MSFKSKRSIGALSEKKLNYMVDDFFDDSVSNISSIYQSEVVAHTIRNRNTINDHEKAVNLSNIKSENIQVNFNVQLAINDKEKPTAIVYPRFQQTTDPQPISNNFYSVNEKEEVITRKISFYKKHLNASNKYKIFGIASIFTILIVTGVIFGIRSNSSTVDTKSIISTTSITPTIVSSTDSQLTTTILPDNEFVLIFRPDWGADPVDDLFFRSPYQKTPIIRVIIMQTGSNETFTTLDDYKVWLRARQLSSLQRKSYDIEENFLIGFDGTIFEGRGWMKEGAHTTVSGNNFNQQAIGISFIGNYSEIQPSTLQTQKLKLFLDHAIANDTLHSDYKIFYKTNLVSSKNVDEDPLWIYIKETFPDKFYFVPQIISRADWKAMQGPPKYLNNRSSKSKKVVIISSDTEKCSTQDECIEIILKIQKHLNTLCKDIVYSHIFGANSSIFEGTGFDFYADVVKDAAYNTMGLLLIGNYNETIPVNSLLKQLDLFLDFAVTIGKLDSDYTVNTLKQLVYNSTNPGDEFSRLIETWKRYDPKPKPSVYKTYNIINCYNCLYYNLC